MNFVTQEFVCCVCAYVFENVHASMIKTLFKASVSHPEVMRMRNLKKIFAALSVCTLQETLLYCVIFFSFFGFSIHRAVNALSLTIFYVPEFIDSDTRCRQTKWGKFISSNRKWHSFAFAHAHIFTKFPVISPSIDVYFVLDITSILMNIKYQRMKIMSLNSDVKYAATAVMQSKRFKL